MASPINRPRCVHRLARSLPAVLACLPSPASRESRELRVPTVALALSIALAIWSAMVGVPSVTSPLISASLNGRVRRNCLVGITLKRAINWHRLQHKKCSRRPLPAPLETIYMSFWPFSGPWPRNMSINAKALTGSKKSKRSSLVHAVRIIASPSPGSLVTMMPSHLP